MVEGNSAGDRFHEPKCPQVKDRKTFVLSPLCNAELEYFRFTTNLFSML